MASTQRQRLPPETFDLPVDAMHAGVYSDKYFVRTRHVLQAAGHSPNVLMQVFCRATAVLCGVDEAVAILKLASDDWSALTVRALHDGDEVEPLETVMTIEGPYDRFAHLETLYLGALARGTRIATQTRRVVDAAAPKDVLFFPARHDHYAVQAGDGYAAHLAGAAAVVDGCAGVLVGRRRHRHRAPRCDCGLRWEHGARGQQVRGTPARLRPVGRAGGFRERQREDCVGGCAGSRATPLRSASGYLGAPWWTRA